MALAAGSKLGPYEIAGPLGAGGMGEVYLARDSRLGRDVAIKALPDALAQDPDRLARFEHEAKVLASLNHSGVGAIYGLEEAGGHRYLVLEYVEGETLADRLKRGAIPVDEALPLAKQIAEALASVPVGSADGLEFGAPQVLMMLADPENFDISADAQHILTLAQDASAAAQSPTIVLNWAEGLTKK